MSINFWKLILLFWILLLLFVLYAYFFEPELFHRMFGQYTGPGTPFINAP